MGFSRERNEMRAETRKPWPILSATLTLVLVIGQPVWAQDCNGNRVDDAQDIADGTSNDCNDNGVPDECDFGPEHVLNDDFEWAGSVHAADLDGDGDLDVLGTAHQAGRVTWWENAQSDGSVWIERDVQTEYDHAKAVSAPDIDGDGDLDVLAASGDLNEVTWWENVTGDGTVWVEHTVAQGFVNAQSVYGADFDGDGDIDILGAASKLDRVNWWENIAGDGTVWVSHLIDNDFNFVTQVLATDLDGDRDMDVLGAAEFEDSITWWENSAGDGSVWIRQDIDDDFNGARSVDAADVDGDGDLDVLGTATIDDEIVWWENAAGDATIWIEHLIGEDLGLPGAVYAADIDDDGDMDVLGTNFTADTITWWENTTGDGTEWIRHTLDDDFNGATAVHAADLDGDEDIDILAAAQSDNEITWWRNDLECLGCAHDLDCDCSVGTGDLIMLLGAWGNPYDTEDLIDLLGAWGACGK